MTNDEFIPWSNARTQLQFIVKKDYAFRSLSGEELLKYCFLAENANLLDGLLAIISAIPIQSAQRSQSVFDSAILRNAYEHIRSKGLELVESRPIQSEFDLNGIALQLCNSFANLLYHLPVEAATKSLFRLYQPQELPREFYDDTLKESLKRLHTHYAYHVKAFSNHGLSPLKRPGLR